MSPSLLPYPSTSIPFSLEVMSDQNHSGAVALLSQTWEDPNYYANHTLLLKPDGTGEVHTFITLSPPIPTRSRSQQRLLLSQIQASQDGYNLLFAHLTWKVINCDGPLNDTTPPKQSLFS